MWSELSLSGRSFVTDPEEDPLVVWWWEQSLPPLTWFVFEWEAGIKSLCTDSCTPLARSVPSRSLCGRQLVKDQFRSHESPPIGSTRLGSCRSEPRFLPLSSYPIGSTMFGPGIVGDPRYPSKAPEK